MSHVRNLNSYLIDIVLSENRRADTYKFPGIFQELDPGVLHISYTVWHSTSIQFILYALYYL